MLYCVMIHNPFWTYVFLHNIWQYLTYLWRHCRQSMIGHFYFRSQRDSLFISDVYELFVISASLELDIVILKIVFLHNLYINSLMLSWSDIKLFNSQIMLPFDITLLITENYVIYTSCYNITLSHRDWSGKLCIYAECDDVFFLCK